jgi:hypothetical protein
VERFDLQRIMRAAVAPAMRRYFSFGDSHCGTCSLEFKSEISKTALVQAPCPRKRGGSTASHAVKARPIATFRTCARERCQTAKVAPRADEECSRHSRARRSARARRAIKASRSADCKAPALPPGAAGRPFSAAYRLA